MTVHYLASRSSYAPLRRVEIDEGRFFWGVLTGLALAPFCWGAA
jgi:hypothetical protein